jgi:hypothetical protein
MRCVEFGVRCAEGTVRNDVDAAYTGCVPLEDSPYLATPAAYADFLHELRPVPHTVMVGGMTGNPTPYEIGPDPAQLTGPNPPLPEEVEKTLLASCMRKEPTVPSGVSTAEPAVRLRAFLDAFPEEDSTSASICDDPFREVLLEIAAKFGDRFRDCLLGNVDVDDVNLAVPGLQLECQISDVDGAGVEAVIPRCPMTDATTPVLASLPCWWAEVDTTACASTETGAVLHVEREGTPPVGTRVVARCVAD